MRLTERAINMISSNRIRQLIIEESRDFVDEAGAHEEDLIARAYQGGDVDAGGAGEDQDQDNDTFDGSGGDDKDSDHQTDNEPDDEQEQNPQAQDERETLRQMLSTSLKSENTINFGLELFDVIGISTADAAAPYIMAAIPRFINSAEAASRMESFEAAVHFLTALPELIRVLTPIRKSLVAFRSSRNDDMAYEMLNQIRRLMRSVDTSKLTVNLVNRINVVCDKNLPKFNGDDVADDALIIVNGSQEAFEDLLVRSKIVESPADEPKDQVSTEANPLPEGRNDRMISIIMESPKKPSSKSSTKKQATKSSEKLPPIPTTVEFDREMRGIVSAYHMGEDIESWLMNDIFGSARSPHGLVRKSGFTGDDDFYRKGAASYIAQHLATHHDPELRSIGQRVLRNMKDKMGHRFLSLGSGDGLDYHDDDY